MLFSLNPNINLSNLLDAMPERTCVIDSEWTVLYCNEGFYQMIKDRHGFDQLVGKHFMEDAPQYYLDKWEGLVKRVLAGEFYDEIITRNKYTSDKHIRVALSPIKNGNQVCGAIIKLYDITIEKESQKDLMAFKQLAENLPNTDVLLCDTSLNVLIAGGGEMKKYGVDGSYFTEKNLVDLAKELQLEELIPIYHEALKGYHKSYEYTYAENYYWLEAYPIFENEQVKNIIVITRNISEFKNINLKLQQLNDTKDAILSVVAHDLRNPISAITGFTDVLKQNHNNSITQKHLDLISKSCNYSLSIINDLLDITQLGNEEFKLELNDYELNSAIKQAMNSFDFQLREKGIELVFNTTHEDIFVRLNPDKFNSVLSNLISNAIKFSNPNNRIIINTKLHHKEVLITCQDFGIGIPENMQQIIFNRFTKAGRTGTSGEKSFGLGMSIVKQIIKLHHGKIWLESEEQKGTTFFVQLESII
jgi:signal transduction histidine kinase